MAGRRRVCARWPRRRAWTARPAARYVEAAEVAGVVRDGGVGQLGDAVIGAVVAAVRPVRPDGHGTAWQLLVEQREQIAAVGRSGPDGGEDRRPAGPARGGGAVSDVAPLLCGVLRLRPRSPTTVRVADGEPGVECQIDFGRMGLLPDPATGRRRVAHALIFTAVYSRHMFVWLTYSQTLDAVIAGCEAAWAFFGGVSRSSSRTT